MSTNEMKATAIMACLVFAAVAGKMSMERMAGGGVDSAGTTVPIEQPAPAKDPAEQPMPEGDEPPAADSAPDIAIATTTQEQASRPVPYRPRGGERKTNEEIPPGAGEPELTGENVQPEEEGRNGEAQALGETVREGRSVPGMELQPVGISYLCLAKAGHLALIAENEKTAAWVQVLTCPASVLELPEIRVLAPGQSGRSDAKIEKTVIDKWESQRLQNTIAAHAPEFYYEHEKLIFRYYLTKESLQRYVQLAEAYKAGHPVTPDSKGLVKLVVEIDARGQMTIVGQK